MSLESGTVGFYHSAASHGKIRLAYESWGPQQGRKVICVHGLTCNRHDFVVLANALAANGYHAISVDLAGRGESDFLSNPNDYTHAQYAQDILALLAHLNLAKDETIDYIGTSLGGLIGFDLASRPQTQIARLVLNDIGPEVPDDALAFIKAVIKHKYEFPDQDSLYRFMKDMRSLSYGPVSDEQWRFMAQKYARTLPNGKITYHYDPAIADIFETHPVGTTDLWACWNKIKIPVLALRGENSLVFPQPVLDKMTGTHVQSHIIPECGHVPSLLHQSQIDLISNWLSQTQALDLLYPKA